MRKFIISFIIKTCLLIVCVISLVVLYIYKTSLIDEELKKIAKTNSLLIMGDSQMQRLNPELFDDKTYNFSSRSEHYFFTHSKLKKIFSTPKHTIKKVLLGVSIHSFSPMYKKTFDVRYIEGKYSFRRFMFFNNFIKSNEFSNFSFFFKYNSCFIDGLYRDVEKDGYYKSLGKNPNNAIIDRIYDVHYPNDIENRITLSQEKYLNNIIDLCSKNSVKLILISTPMHSYYKEKVDNRFYNVLSKIIKQSNCEYINFLNENTPINYFSDANHLNVNGAIVYSKKINYLINLNKNVI